MATTITGTATFDKTDYNAGDTMTLTVVRSATTSQIVEATSTTVLTAADGTTETLSAGPVNVTRAVRVPVSVATTDDGQRTYTVVSDDGSTAVLNTTA